jgi:hypothetical protein
MTPEQLEKLYELIAAGKVPDEKTSENRVYLRGWNGGIQFVEEQIKKVLAT